MLQRRDERLGKNLGKTTGWIHRANLKQFGVNMLGGVQYTHIDDAGLHVLVDNKPDVIEVDTIVTCAGQEPNRSLADELKEQHPSVHIIGGADVAAELDAKRAIDQGSRLGAQL